jgi:predicted dehydrogenase
MSRNNRRRFLEQSMFAAASVWAAEVALRRDEVVAQDAAPQSKSPNETINVAVMGVNGRGASHLDAFSGRKDTRVTKICDVDKAVGGRACEGTGKRQGGMVPQLEEDIRKVLDDKSIDVVSIATPNHWHSLGAIWAMQAGKDVYVEKPVSHNVFEGRSAVAAARRHKRICQTGTQSRSSAGLREAIEWFKQGELGALKVARGLCYKRRKEIGPRGEYAVPADVNYDLWCGPAPMNPVTRPRFHYDWHWQWDFGNGDLGNQGIHQMDIARWFLGQNQLCNGVMSYGGRLGYKDAGETPNTQVVVHDYGTQTLVFEVRGLETPAYKDANVGVILECENGYVVIGSYEAAVAFSPEGKEIKKFGGGGDHFANFVDACRSRNHSDLHADIEEGHLSSALCHLGNISYRLGEQKSATDTLKVVEGFKSNDKFKETFDRTMAHLIANGVDTTTEKLQAGVPLVFDGKAEKFPDNEAANKMLTREYRKPYVVPGPNEV